MGSAGATNAHHIWNRTDAPLRYLCAGTNPDRDTVHYPDDGQTLHWDRPDARVVAADGTLLDEISVPLALRSLPGLLPPWTDSFDPTHLNDIDIVPAALADAFPMLKEGDLLVSLRNVDLLVAIDPRRKVATWAMAGPFRRQHDPDLLPNGRLLVFDNLGGDPACGRSRVLEIDPVTRRVVWAFEGRGDQTFYAKARGEQQVLPNGNILIVDPHNGRLLEIAPSAGNRTVWEWVNMVEPGLVGLVTDAQRVPRTAAAWLGRPCP